MLATRICSYPDAIPDNGRSFAKYGYFPSGYTIKWRFATNDILSHKLNVGGFTTSWITAMTVAFNRWSRHLDVSFQYQKSGSVNWLITTGRIDGPSGTLAWAELPPSANFTGKLTQKIDTSERFIASDEPNPRYIDIVRVMTHEAGHSLGLGHLPVRSYSGALLNPMYGTVTHPTRHDINELRKVYKKAPSVDDGTNKPTNPGDDDMLIVTGKQFHTLDLVKHLNNF